ncbi:cytochrome C nitrite reductase [Sphingomonas sp. GlSt437]|uniref:cytochrome C nitrite reductase n=1 Tax=Sphingomonas sp. GlSt437 TaxID=3389970 RepID=UPI003A8B15FF
MNRLFAQLAFAVPALALFLAAAWMVLGGHRTTGPSSAISEGGVSLKSTTITLPTTEPVLPGGAKSDIITNNCTACHSPEMILMQPPLDAKTWGTEIDKMRSAYKAAIDPKDVPAITAALLALPSQRKPTATPAAPRASADARP